MLWNKLEISCGDGQGVQTEPQEGLGQWLSTVELS